MDTQQYIVNRSWAEVDLDRIAANVKAIKGQVWRTSELMAVVKADAYGHGVSQVVPTLLEAGADRLAVSMLDEAIELRAQHVTAPILVLSYTDPRRADEIVKHKITQTVYSWDLVHAINAAGERRGELVNIHIKVDTGMGRVGLVAGFNTIREIEEISKLPFIAIEGVFTHFATADEEDSTYTRQQFGQFLSLCQELERMGIYIPIKHCCNSAATLRYPEYALDMVRPGLILYGQLPANAEGFKDEFSSAMQLKSNVIHTKTLAKGSSVSYGRTFTTKRETKIATVPIGYADGYTRIMSGKAHALVHGVRVPVVGSICMDACMLDVTDVPGDVLVGDEVVLFGRQAKPDGSISEITIDEVASWAGTISYEVTALIGKRVPRVYIQNGERVAVETVLI